MRIVLIASVLLLLQGPNPMRWQAAKKDIQDTQNKQTPYAASENTARNVVPTNDQKDAPAQKGNAERNSTTNEERPINVGVHPRARRDWYDGLYIWLTFSLVVVGVLAIASALLTLRDIQIQGDVMIQQVTQLKRQVEIMDKQATAASDNAAAAKAAAQTAEKNLAISISKERARVRIQITKIDLSLAGPPYFEIPYRLFNYGPSAAFIIDSGAEFRMSASADPPTDPPSRHIPNLDVILPNTNGMDKTAIGFGVDRNQEVINSINEGKQFLHFYGFVRYKDISNDSGADFWQTTFMRLWSVTDLKNFDGTLFSYWSECGPPEGNRET